MTAAATTATHTNCLRCGRKLSSTTSTTRGYGPTCHRKIRAAARAEAVTDFKPFQVAKAEELIEQGGIVRIRATVFRAVSSKGTDTYLTAPQACNCPAGLAGRQCYHRAAARMLLAA